MLAIASTPGENGHNGQNFFRKVVSHAGIGVETVVPPVYNDSMNTETTCTLPARCVMVGDRVTGVSGPIIAIDDIIGGLVFYTRYASFTRATDESVTIRL